jgi:histidine triad (HIT) family protein
VLSHQPADYQCPFCRLAAELDNDGNWSKQTDVIWHDRLVTAFINVAFWPANAGPVLVIPNEHYENVYSVPDEVLAAVQVVGKRIALAMKVAYGCDGTSFRQHNEPAGNQDVWHYHLHVFPRYHGDELYRRKKRPTTPAERAPYAEKLRSALS